MCSKIKLTDDNRHLINICFEEETNKLVRKLPHYKADTRVAGITSTIECPVCGSIMRYEWTQVNGLESLTCDTKGCIYYKIAVRSCYPMNYTAEEREIIGNRPVIKRVKRPIEPVKVRRVRRLFEI